MGSTLCPNKWIHLCVSARCGIISYSNGVDSGEEGREDKEGGWKQNSCTYTLGWKLLECVVSETVTNPFLLIGLYWLIYLLFLDRRSAFQGGKNALFKIVNQCLVKDPHLPSKWKEFSNFLMKFFSNLMHSETNQSNMYVFPRDFL